MSKQLYAALLSSAFMLFGASALAATQSNASQGNTQEQQKAADSAQQANGNEKRADDENAKSTSELVVSRLKHSQILASSINGMTVKNGSGDDAEKIGTVGDLIISKKNHRVEGIVVDIGGFLGIGTKKVGITTDAIKSMDRKEKLIVVSVTKEELSDAPGFKNKEDQKETHQKEQQKEQQKQEQGQSQPQPATPGSSAG